VAEMAETNNSTSRSESLKFFEAQIPYPNVMQEIRSIFLFLRTIMLHPILMLDPLLGYSC
jgi:hypothetical protein